MANYLSQPRILNQILIQFEINCVIDGSCSEIDYNSYADALYHLIVAFGLPVEGDIFEFVFNSLNCLIPNGKKK